MALTVLKYRKSSSGDTQNSSIAHKKNSIIKIRDGSGLVINKIPAVKRSAVQESTSSPAYKSSKYALQTIASAGTPHTTLQWQPTTAAKPLAKKHSLGAVISSLPSNTIVGSSTTRTVLSNGVTVSPVAAGPVGTMQVRRPTIYIKREAPARTMRQMTVDLIEKNPKLHLGLDAKRLQAFKNVIATSTALAMPLADIYLTLRKLRQNEDCALLGELFEISEEEVMKIVCRSVASLARCMRSMIRWPDSKKYYDRHKELPFEFRKTLAHVQSLIETVETEMRLQPNNLECQSYKFILCITPQGIISYVSDAYLGKYDDLAIFAASKFKEVIPKYLTLMVEPGKGLRRTRTTHNRKPKRDDSSTGNDSNTDSAEESANEVDSDNNDAEAENEPQRSATLSDYAIRRLASDLAADQTLSVIDNELRSSKVKEFSIPTMRVEEPICRQRIRETIDRMREFRILQDCALREPLMFQYLNEIIVVIAAFTNLMLE